MRLLNVKTLQLEEFWGTDDVQPYAILSHTWLDKAQEPTCQDIENETKKDTKGYQKLESCCRQAEEDEIGYIWADTCCIDKTNKVELQEAIDSMFNWYRDSQVCYAHLSDYDKDTGHRLDKEKFGNSRWFKRGWTLQELMRPKS